MKIDENYKMAAALLLSSKSSIRISLETQPNQKHIVKKFWEIQFSLAMLIHDKTTTSKLECLVDSWIYECGTWEK